MSGALGLSRVHHLFYFVMSGVVWVVSLLLAGYYVVLRERSLVDVLPLLQGGLVFGLLFWGVGMLMARKHRRLMAVVAERQKVIDGIAKSMSCG